MIKYKEKQSKSLSMQVNIYFSPTQKVELIQMDQKLLAVSSEPLSA